MNDTRRIAIVGAGVAGMALAIFAKRQGCQVSLYERSDEISSIGAGVTLWPNAMYVLQRMGLDEEISRVGGEPRFMRQFDQYGVPKGEFDLEEVNAICGLPSVTILRRDLMTVLAKTLSDLGVKIHLGCEITEQDVEALKQECELVVGADGRMNSVVRRTLHQGKIAPCYHGFVNVIGVSQLQEAVLDGAIHEYRGTSERFGIVPVSAGSCFWAGAWNTPVDQERPLSAWWDDLQRRFSGWPDPVKHVLRFHDETRLNRIFVHDIDPLPYWHEDNVLVIGDAAHASLPTSGQGACQALEDAWHLARMIGEKPSMESVLSAFYQQRIAKVSAAQAVGRQLASRIFGCHPELPSSTPDMSAEKLCQLWMQGLQ
ncbi:FAD-dependent monooxygenase [Halomonas organivorans]|uniref:2-polyprenyl-6-methoxyphenol hydroxylase-like FAD-dependent oxidoreductase n=1 Tax=Halomonas organivorans TaxID=257772 RepID=A0A7W5G4Z5_9GAMM|nr:FAD-dependent monooxygenase [Halomonas organivorans]MBB3139881.1 2-polyprenyl-6-methoxyphenol hydroxylase-like FAD-dependent oxidoreductase [Halomonas organivorans]